ncbi:MAG: hypothetical protein KGJ86_10455 [Chloroflexota bacterium]|nr:hypothetical protein [Chloroflexota bacterium]
MRTLVLGRSGASATLVPYPTLDELIRAFDGQHVGLGYFKIRVGGQDVYLDREDEETALAYGETLGQEQRRIYSVAMGADELAGIVGEANGSLSFEIRECRGTPVLAGAGVAREDTSGQGTLF